MDFLFVFKITNNVQIEFFPLLVKSNEVNKTEEKQQLNIQTAVVSMIDN